LDVLVALILLGVFLIVLVLSSHLTITNTIKVSAITGLGKTTLGFILIAFSTSIPELSVAILSVLGNGEKAAVSVGNVIGSNIVNICLIIGVATLLVVLQKRSRNVKMIPTMAKEEFGSLYFGLFIASLIPLMLVYLTFASQFIGLVLVLIFGLYTYQLSKIRIPQENNQIVSGEMKRKVKLYVVFTFLGVAGVVLSAYFIVESSVALAEFAGVSKSIIGATIIAFGTSLPEFSIDVNAFLKGHSALAFGDIVGSCFINITLILGITLLAAPFSVTNIAFFTDLVIFSLIANLFLWYFLSMERLGWKEGVILLFIYILFLATTIGTINLRPQTG
jgi:cation:H+ antiporter